MRPKQDKQLHSSHGAKSANKLLERAPESSYTEEWTALLAKEQDQPRDTHEVASILFRIGQEWLAFPAIYLHEVTNNKVVHKIPHQRNTMFKGLVNLRGQLRICISLGHLLEIKESAVPSKTHGLNYKRMISIGRDGSQWIFPVDEVSGVYHFNLDHMKYVPVTVVKSKVNFLKGVILHEGMNIGYIDEELLFASLQRSLL